MCRPSIVNTPVVWNKELLFVGGLLTCIAYEVELADIHALWSEGAGSIN